MNGSAPFQERYVRVVEQLAASPLVSIDHEKSGEDVLDGAAADVVFAGLAADYDLHLDEAFRRLYFTSKQLHVAWRLTADSTCTGEVCLQNITEWAAGEWGPDEGALPPEEHAIVADLYTIDYEPRSGTGSVTAISVPHARPLSLRADRKIWYCDGGHRLEQLDVDYAGYLDAVLLTVGAPGWQYLFADVNLRREVTPSVVAALEHCLAVLPEIFPGHDYEPLRRRFDARM
ncbi:hypothetical protein [Spirillospora sp. NPDC048824]|uniref:hypothetical protein n=1 Tax=Spirillospora sp. NPDC048824 TaxID=3364526 RepID=UPI0037223DC8